MKDAAHRESAGEAYEPYVGRWSRPVAAEFLQWLAVPANARWLDAEIRRFMASPRRGI